MMYENIRNQDDKAWINGDAMNDEIGPGNFTWAQIFKAVQKYKDENLPEY